jgi:metal-sulfur cluster biosynthetic enzyme
VPRDSLPIDSARVMAALARVDDPELDFSIVDLGLVHESSVDSAGNVRVVMALTTPECPYGLTLAEDALQALKAVPGARRISLKLDPSIPWDPSRLYGKARERYDSLFRDDSAYNR